MQEDRRERALEIARHAGAETLLAAHPGTGRRERPRGRG
jgi:hypothetical protein